MTVYVGLTDDPDTRKTGHGSPSDFKVVKTFTSEPTARQWEKDEIAKVGQTGGPGGEGWRNGYKYKITASTKE